MKRFLITTFFFLFLSAPTPKAFAHGGLPLSLQILRNQSDGTLYVPVLYWGIWVGTDEGPWQWICEEAINFNPYRHYALSPNGAYYATDTRGVTVSQDHGCNWVAYAGAELPLLRTSDVVVDPNDPTTAY